MSKTSYLFAKISGSNAYFSKPFFALKPWVQAGRFEYHEPYNWKNLFWTNKGVLKFKKVKKDSGYSGPNENLKYTPRSEHQMLPTTHY